MPGERVRVLVVDDDAAICELLRLALEDDGYEVATAANGAAGLGRAVAFAPDVILLDMHMPVMDGPSFAAMYRRPPLGARAHHRGHGRRGRGRARRSAPGGRLPRQAVRPGPAGRDDRAGPRRRSGAVPADRRGASASAGPPRSRARRPRNGRARERRRPDAGMVARATPPARARVFVPRHLERRGPYLVKGAGGGSSDAGAVRHTRPTRSMAHAVSAAALRGRRPVAVRAPTMPGAARLAGPGRRPGQLAGRSTPAGAGRAARHDRDGDPTAGATLRQVAPLSRPRTGRLGRASDQTRRLLDEIDRLTGTVGRLTAALETAVRAERETCAQLVEALVARPGVNRRVAAEVVRVLRARRNSPELADADAVRARSALRERVVDVLLLEMPMPHSPSPSGVSGHDWGRHSWARTSSSNIRSWASASSWPSAWMRRIG